MTDDIKDDVVLPERLMSTHYFPVGAKGEILKMLVKALRNPGFIKDNFSRVCRLYSKYSNHYLIGDVLETVTNGKGDAIVLVNALCSSLSNTDTLRDIMGNGILTLDTLYFILTFGDAENEPKIEILKEKSIYKDKSIYDAIAKLDVLPEMKDMNDYELIEMFLLLTQNPKWYNG